MSCGPSASDLLPMSDVKCKLDVARLAAMRRRLYGQHMLGMEREEGEEPLMLGLSLWTSRHAVQGPGNSPPASPRFSSRAAHGATARWRRVLGDDTPAMERQCMSDRKANCGRCLQARGVSRFVPVVLCTMRQASPLQHPGRASATSSQASAHTKLRTHRPMCHSH